MKNYHLGIYEKALPQDLTLKEKLKAAKKCGFDFLELSVDESEEKMSRLDWSTDKIFELKKTSYRVDLPILTMCLSGNRKFPIGSLDDGASQKGVAIIKKAVDFAAALGIRIIQLAGYDIYYDYEKKSNHTSKGRFFYNLRMCVGYAAKYGVILALETMENDFLNTIDKAMYYVREIDSPYLAVYPDTGNITNGCRDIVQDIRSGKGHIAAAHLKESKPGVYRDLMFGTGDVDFDMAIRTYREMGVNMFLAEFWHDGEDDWMKKAKYAQKFLAEKLDASERGV